MADIRSATAFLKCAEILRRLKSASWIENRAERFRLKDPLNIEDIATNPEEANFLAHVVCMVLEELPSGGGANGANARMQGGEDELVPHNSFMLLSDCLKKTPLDLLRRDHSLREAFILPSPQLTPSFEPRNVRQAMEFVWWKESQRWRHDQDGYHFRKIHSHGLPKQAMFYYDSEFHGVNAALRAMHDDSASGFSHSKKLTALPQITTRTDAEGWPELHVSADDAKAIFVDYLGLDPKVLGLETPGKERA